MEHHMEHSMAKIDANDCGSTSILQHTATTHDKNGGPQQLVRQMLRAPVHCRV